MESPDYLLPRISVGKFNATIKKIIELAGWTEIIGKTRQRGSIKDIVIDDGLNGIPEMTYQYDYDGWNRLTNVNTNLSVLTFQRQK